MSEQACKACGGVVGCTACSWSAYPPRAEIDQKSRAEEAKKFDLTRTGYFYGPRTTSDARGALERLYHRENRYRDKSSRVHDIIKDEEKIIHDVIVERDAALRRAEVAEALLTDWAHTDQIVSFGQFGEEACRCCEQRGSRIKEVTHLASCRWVRTRLAMGLPVP